MIGFSPTLDGKTCAVKSNATIERVHPESMNAIHHRLRSSATQPTKVGRDEMVMVADVLSEDVARQLLEHIQGLSDEHWVRWHRDAHCILDEQQDWRALVPCWNDVVTAVEPYFSAPSMHHDSIDFRMRQIIKRFTTMHRRSFLLGLEPNTSIVLCLGEGRPVRFYHPPSKSTLDFWIPVGVHMFLEQG